MAYKITLKATDKKTCPLMIRFSKNGIPFKFYSGKSVNKKNWDEDKQIVKKDEDNYKPINEYLEKWEKALRTIIEEKEAKQIRLDEDEIKEELDKLFNKAFTAEAKKNVYDFVGFYDTFIEYHQHYQKFN